MPTYEYLCKSCGERLEVVQSFSDDALTTCPACEGQLRKVFGNIGIAFKGSGFYKNDNRSSSSASSTKTDTAPAKTDSSSPAATPAPSGDSGGSSSPAPVSAPSTSSAGAAAT